MKLMIDPSNDKDPVIFKIDEMNKKIVHDDDAEFIDTRGYIPLSVAILKQIGNLKLKGATGTGKTLLAKTVAKKLKAAYFDQQMTLDTQSFNLVSEVRIHQGSTMVNLGVIPRWLMHEGPALLFLDEINFSMAGVLSLLHAVTDDRRHLYVPDLGKTIPRGDDKYLVIAFNPAERAEYVGTSILNIAFSRRFEGIELDYLTEREERAILKKRGLTHGKAAKITQVASFSRTAYLEGELITPITLGNLKAWADLMVHQNVELEDIKRLVYGLYPTHQHNLIDKIWANKVD